MVCSDAENEDEDDDANETENDETMDTSDAAEPRPRNPDDEYNFADYDNEGGQGDNKTTESHCAHSIK